MEFSKDLIEKAKTAKSAEELLKLAKAEGVELSEEEAAKYFAELHKTGELSDDELDNVVGGCYVETDDKPKYSVGQRVRITVSNDEGVFFDKCGCIKSVHEQGKFEGYFLYTIILDEDAREVSFRECFLTLA
ncbi:MAG: hypothetical protein ACI4MH_01755 [Candidatus Coproplasma sp.]